MKKIFILFGIMLTFTVFGSSINVTVQSGGIINTVSNLQGTKMSAKIYQNNEGLIGFSLSPVVSYSDNSLYIGEIRFTNWQIQNVNTPSSQPQYAGIVLNKNNFTVFASNPVFCPSSDKALGLIYNFKQSAIGILINEPTGNAEEQTDYQINWNSINSNKISALLNFKAEKEIAKHIIKFETYFNQEQKAKISICKNNVELSYEKYADNSVKHSFELVFKGFLSTKFSVEKNEISNYSGVSQSGTIELETTLSLYNFQLIVTSVNEYKSDSAKLGTDLFVIKYRSGSFNAQISTKLNRTDGTEYGLTFPDAEFGSDNVNFAIKDKKAYLTLSFSKQTGLLKTTVSMSQNRKYSISLTILQE